MKLLIDLQGAQTESRFRGIGRHARMLVAEMIAAGGGHDIHLLLNAKLREGFDDLLGEFAPLLPAGNIHVFDPPAPVRERDSGNIWRMRASELYREMVIANIAPDLLYVTSLFEGVNDDAVTSIGLMETPYAVAATLFDLIPLADPERYVGEAVVQRHYYRRLLSLKRADHLIAISEHAKKEAVEYLQIPAERIDVALLAAEPSFRPSSGDPEERGRLLGRYKLPASYIFYVGAIEPRKNIPLIIEAFGKLTPAERGDTVLVFGGRLSDAERDQLRIAAVRYGVDADRLVLPGFIAEGDLAPLYAAARLFVFPSMHEGFGLPPLEAMACGTPVLVARNSSLPEVVGREDQLFGTFDAADLARKMARVLTDRGYADELGAWGIERSGQFSWERAGRQTLAALERLHEEHRDRTRLVFGRKPRLAFVSPLPGDRTGIAGYGAELLRELGRFFEIECIIEGTHVTDPWVLANFALRDVGYFRTNADKYDYILYQIGNSDFHAHMFDLMVEYPGLVILHDFFLSGIFEWLDNVGRTATDMLAEELYRTHGLPALLHVAEYGRSEAVVRYPANRIVFENAHGVIVHSHWSIARACEVYGPAITERMRYVPLLRAVRPLPTRAEARRKLGIDDDAFILTTFGFVAETKLGDRLVDAWATTAAAESEGAKLVFVGDHPPGPWGEAFDRQIADLPDHISVTVTGYVDSDTYDLYLAAADVAVQLRQRTRGETSAALLDCMAAGLPVIVNAHGTSAEVDRDCVVMLDEDVSAGALCEAIDVLFRAPDRRARLGAAARVAMLTHHHPAHIGEQVRDALFAFTDRTAIGRQGRLLRAISDMFAPVSPDDQDLTALSDAVARSAPAIGLPRLFYDITLLAETDAHTGIERVSRGFLNHLMRHPPTGYVLEPIRFEGETMVHARRFISKKFHLPLDGMADEPILARSGDIYLSVEWAADMLPRIERTLRSFRQIGGHVVIGVHDLLPFQMPHRFPDFIPGVAQNWFRALLRVADDIVCVSRAVADDVLAYGAALADPLLPAVRVGWFHNAAGIADSIPTKGLPKDSTALLARMADGPSFLMVGTVEPRKGHLQVLAAFERLWADGVAANLTIVGRKGWMVEEVVTAIGRSPQAGRRLNWVQGASDEYLERIYAQSTALIAASEGEGFGLPLVEGAMHGLPLIVRNIGVFREIAGEGAYYFDADTGDGLAAALKEWLALWEAGKAPSSAAVERLDWHQAAAQFWSAVFAETPYGVISKA